MLGLKDKNSPREKVHGVRALTPSQWQTFLDKRSGEFVVIGGKLGDQTASMAYSRATTQWIFDELVWDCRFSSDGYSVKVVGPDRLRAQDLGDPLPSRAERIAFGARFVAVER